MKKNAGKAPSYQMYPKDWNEDTALKMCSLAAQGLWIRLINTSYDMPEKGVFRLSKISLTKEKILSLLSGGEKEKSDAFDELIEWGVIKQDDDKSFYCKRLRKDMALREIRKEAGKLGGNPNLLNQKPNQNLTPSSSNSNSSSIALELNKLSLRFDDKIKRLFGPLTRNEQVTFSKIRFFLISFSDLEKMEQGIQYIADASKWGADHDKNNVEVKKCFVSKIKKNFNWKP